MEARLVQEEMDWLMQSHPVLEQQILLLLEILPVLTGMRSYSGQLEMRWHNLKGISYSLAASRLLMSCWLSPAGRQDLLSPCFLPTVLEVSLYRALSLKWACLLASEHPFHSAF